ncbi:hypothetical protein RhiirA1_401868 [Rhizophagus irregularis]|uniref:Uncharacterized protein n=2 Tax=Rhizophagus irregularis TaxID=588596 RepID=A0A2N0R0G9_9GLOM|nr:hypothetical protein RhiirA1_401868 [Rhizophagus irregularis]
MGSVNRSKCKLHPFNDPDIVAEMVRNLPIKEFGKHLKINRLWYNCCKAKLWKQHEKAEKIYDRAVEKKEKAGDAFGRSFEGKGIGNHELEWKVYHKACKEITEARKKQIMNKKMTAQTSTQAQVISKFGEQKKAFSIDKHKQLIVTAKSMSDLNQAKRYLYGYFILYFNPHGVFMWQSEIKNLEHIPDKNISKLIHPITKVFYTQSEQGLPQKVEFNINKWFMIEYSTVCVATCDPQKSLIFKLDG